MKRERRQPTKAEWAAITSKRPAVRKIPPPDKERGIEPKPGCDQEAQKERCAA